MKVIVTYGIDQKPTEIEFSDFIVWLRKVTKILDNGFKLYINVQIGD